MAVMPSLRIQGLDLSGVDLGWMQSWIDGHPEWSRFRLRHELCLHWKWRNAAGHLKTYAARSLLAKLEQQGRLRLPPIRLSLRRVQPWSRRTRALDYPLSEPSPIVGSLAALRPVELRALPAGSAAERRAEAQLLRFHYRGLNRPVGAHLYSCVGQTQGRSRQDRQHRLQVGVKDVYLYLLPRAATAFNVSSPPLRTATAAA